MQILKLKDCPNLVHICAKNIMKSVRNASASKSFKCSKIKGLRALIGVLTKAQPSMGNNPMVGATVAVAVAVENAQK